MAEPMEIYAKKMGLYPVSARSVDDVVREAQRFGVTQLLLSKQEMQAAAHFVGANCGNTEWGSQVIRTGQVDKLLGCTLILDVSSNNSTKED